MIDLPINEVLDDIKERLQEQRRLIVQAPPGAGKSTRVPLALLDAPWLKEKIIIMLEPRRMAARMVATQMANLLGEAIGKRVGYQMKMESCYSSETKIFVVTEAILVRMLQGDETLQRVGLVIFDEFHERSIYSDLSLALCTELQEILRDDLRLLIMSATLNAEELSSLLGDAPIITSNGRSYSVESIYLDIRVKEPQPKNIRALAHKTILNSIKSDRGDILVFLQGAREIHLLQNSLMESLKGSDIEILPLYSSLEKSAQRRAILPSKSRKIILSTNIAQTSLTLEGVRVVVDLGYEKLSRFNQATGMNHLESAFISQESATQRAGRAGRLSEGKCYRLWHENRVMQKATKAEILRSDLSALLLDLALWGVEDFKELLWLDIPNAEIVEATKQLLQELEMLDSNYKITPFARDAIALGMHPRLAYMVLKAQSIACSYEASLLAALLSERDIFKNSAFQSDIALRFSHLREGDFSSSYINLSAAKEVKKEALLLYSKLKKLQKCSAKQELFESELLAVLLLRAYPDRLAKRRAKNDNRYKLSSAKGAILHREDSLFNEEYLVVARLDAKAKETFITLALSISLAQIEEHFFEMIKIEQSLKYNAQTQSFDARESRYFLALELDTKPLQISRDFDMKGALLELLKEEGLELLTWSKKARALQARVAFLNANRERQLKELTQEALLSTLDIWLAPYLDKIKSVKELQAIELYPLLLGIYSWQEQQEIEREAPQRVEVPSGSNILIEYAQSDKPALYVKLQEMFGLEQTPSLLNGATPLQIHLLSPARAPIQITYDLASFWKNSYAEVRKELRGKYKRHYWPENPYEAIATSKTKKQM